MDEYILKYLQDVLDAIEELEDYFVGYPKRFDVFEKDRLRISAVERKVEIMGEAINRILKIDPTFELADAKEVVKTRNRVIHGYDSVEPEFLWGLIIRHIPILKDNINSILSQYQ
jgi:uncharacterized protein with HEPN domain